MTVTKKTALTIAAILMLTLMANSAQLHSRRQKKAGSGEAGASATNNLQPSSTTSPVMGSGSPGKLARWAGSNSTSFVLGESSITEDKFGKIGIGTSTPTSTLTVQGMIETTLGGYKFPDGTVQTSAAVGLSSIFHDATLTGDGTSSSPLGIAVPLFLAGSIANNPVLLGQNTGSLGAGVGGVSTNGPGVLGFSQAGTGVVGLSTFAGSSGLQGFSEHGVGVLGQTGDGVAGRFAGDVDVIGTLSKSSGTFKIDHPLDPENKYLYHSFVESPDMMNVYNGNVTTGPTGEAVITLPDYFEALNSDFRYQLTVLDQFAQAIVSSKIHNNRFTILTNAPGVEVSWQVTGIRKDAYAERHRVKVEEDKPAEERGYYLHPDVFEMPEERSVQWARHPEMMLELKQRRGDATQKSGAKTAGHP